MKKKIVTGFICLPVVVGIGVILFSNANAMATNSAPVADQTVKKVGVLEVLPSADEVSAIFVVASPDCTVRPFVKA